MNKNLTIYNSDQRSESARNVDSKLSRPSTKAWIVFLLLIAVVTLPSLTAFSDHRQGKQPAAKAQARAGEPQVIDVVPTLRNKQFREGLNHVYTGPGGIRLSARVKGGKIADWLVTDRNGKEIPSNYSAKAKKCRVCIKPEGGKEVCFYVLCKDIIIHVPTGGTKQA